MNPTSQSTAIPAATPAKKAAPWQRLLPLLITLACFAYLYHAINRAAVGPRHHAGRLLSEKL